MIKRIIFIILIVFVLVGCNLNIDVLPFYVTFESNGGTTYKPVLVDNEIIVFEVPEKEGHTFLGWYKDLNDEKSKVVDSKNLKHNITIFAKWQVNTYTISFDTNGASVIEPITAEYGKDIKAPTNPLKDNFVFKGWYRDKEFKNEYKFTKMGAENITIYAKWGKIEYTVNFYNIYGDLIDTVIVNEGEDVIPPVYAGQTGYKITGWDKSLINVTSNMDVYPTFEVDDNLFPYSKISEIKNSITNSNNDLYVEFAGTVIGFDSMGYAHVADATGSIYVRAKSPYLFLNNKVVIKGYGFVYTGTEDYPEYTVQIKSEGISVETYLGTVSLPKLPEQLKSSDLLNINDYNKKSFLGNLVTVTGYIQTGSTKYGFYIVDEQNKPILGIHHYSSNFQNQISDPNTNLFLLNDGKKVTITGIIYRYYTHEKIFTIQCIGYKNELIIEGGQTGSTNLNIFSINDTHGAFNTDDMNVGLDKVATVIKSLEETNGEYLKIANGDIFQGTYVSNINRGLPLLEALNKMKFDVFVLGNHEFDWGLEEIAKYKDGNPANGEADFPILAANIYKKGTNQRLSWTDEYAIVEKNGLKIGIIGAIGYGLESSILSSMVSEYVFLDPVPIVQRIAAHLRTSVGVDVVVAALHDYDENTNRKISNLSGDSFVDAILCGHTHQQKADFEMRSDGYELPIMQSYTKNGSVGNLIISLENKKVKTATISHINPANYAIDSEIQIIVNKYKEDIDEGNREITYTVEKLSKQKIGEEMITAMLKKYNADYAIINTGGVRDEIGVGNIRVKDVFEVFPFDNTIVQTTMSGSKLKNLFDTQGQYLYFNTNGISQIENTKTYKIVTIDYVFTGSYYTYNFSESTPITDGTLMRTLFIDYLSNK